MSEWPHQRMLPAVTIHTFSLECVGSILRALGGTPWGNVASAAYPVANLALYFPFTIGQEITVVKLAHYNGAAVNGNIDIGIYDEVGTRLTSSGSVAQAGVNNVQIHDIADIPMGPGKFYLAVAMDNVVGTLFVGTLGNAQYPIMAGMAQEAAAFPLPATATFATCSNDYVPAMGLTTRVLI